MKFTRYMVGNFLRLFLLVLLGSIVMFVVIDFVGNIRMWLSRGMNDLGDYYFAYLPYIVYLVTPVALFIGVVASVGNMARHLEMTAIQSSGRSPLRALWPILIVGIAATSFSLYLDDQVLPDANHKRYGIMEPLQQQRKDPRIKDKTNFAFIGSDKSSWFMKQYSGGNKLGRDVLLLLKHDGDLQERYDARRIRWIAPVDSSHDSLSDSTIKSTSGGYWQLEDGYHRVFNKEGEIVVQPFRKEILGDKTEMRPEDFLDDRQRGDEMNASMIKRRIESLRRSGEDTRKLETAYFFKFSGSLMNFIVLLIGVSLAHRFSRSGGLSQKFGIGLFFVFSYYIVIRIGLKMGENGALSPMLGAWIGHIIFGVLAVVMLYRSFRL
ncbi:MAG: LptF/LptG family permease [Fibrobacteraceae bacterium]